MIRPFSCVLVLGEFGLEDFAPELIAGLAIEAQEVSAEVFLLAHTAVYSVSAVRREVHAVPHRDRARRAGTGKIDLPGDVLGRRPIDGQSLLVADPQPA